MSEQDTSEHTELTTVSDTISPNPIIYDSQQKEEEIVKVCEDVWATDRWIVGSLVQIANTAIKTHVDKNGNEYENIDYASRLGAIKEISRMKAEARAKNRDKPKIFVKLIG